MYINDIFWYDCSSVKIFSFVYFYQYFCQPKLNKNVNRHDVDRFGCDSPQVLHLTRDIHLHKGEGYLQERHYWRIIFFGRLRPSTVVISTWVISGTKLLKILLFAATTDYCSQRRKSRTNEWRITLPDKLIARDSSKELRRVNTFLDKRRRAAWQNSALNSRSTIVALVNLLLSRARSIKLLILLQSSKSNGWTNSGIFWYYVGNRVSIRNKNLRDRSRERHDPTLFLFHKVDLLAIWYPLKKSSIRIRTRAGTESFSQTIPHRFCLSQDSHARHVSRNQPIRGTNLVREIDHRS